MSSNKGFTLWLTGLSGAGKTTLAVLLATELRARGIRTEVLDGDEVRTNLSKGLGFSKEDRDTNIRRIGYVSRLLSRNGVVTVSAAISPYGAIRDEVRRAIEQDEAKFIEVFVKCPIAVLAERDVKGLYKKALAGELQGFTGVSDPYEEPLFPDVVVETDRESVEFSLSKILGALEQRGLIPEADLARPRNASSGFSQRWRSRAKSSYRAGAAGAGSLTILKRLLLKTPVRKK
jgi:adenylyl-sulfate kinase